MNEDLLSNNFTEQVEQKMMIKNLIYIKAVVYLVLIYAILNTLDWYIAVENSLGYYFKTNHAFFTYRIQPFISISLTVLAVFNIVYIKKGNTLLNNSIAENDADLFNEGFIYFTRASRLNVIAHTIGIISICIRLFLK